MDRDSSPIGGLARPMQPTKQLFYTTIIMDVAAILLAFFLSVYTAAGIFLYILASRAYSYRGIRLKKFPVLGYLVVVIFQGGLSFFITYHACSETKTLDIPIFPLLAASCLIGGYYPLTQVYQHEADKKDGVKTISMLLGIRGTFVFCGCIFVAATLLLFETFYIHKQLRSFYIFLACMLPMFIFFQWWMLRVWKDPKKADFINSFRMNVLASGCTTICFLILLIIQRLE
jgi:1,4-dihydroxy-2-naphthoate octaprenyltransferase